MCCCMSTPPCLRGAQGQAAELEGALHKREAEVERLRMGLANAGVDPQDLDNAPVGTLLLS